MGRVGGWAAGAQRREVQQAPCHCSQLHAWVGNWLEMWAQLPGLGRRLTRRCTLVASNLAGPSQQ